MATGDPGGRLDRRPPSLVAWTVEVDEDLGELLTWLPAGQAFGFLRGGDGDVGWGEALRPRDP